MFVPNLTPLTPQFVFGLAEFATAVGQYRRIDNAPWVPMVVLFEEKDEVLASLRRYPVKWTVVLFVAGQSPLLAYAGGDLDQAIEEYGHLVVTVQVHER